MTRMHLRQLGIAFGLFLFFSVRSAAAVRIVAPTCGDQLIAGQVVEVSWDGLPNDVDEMELLLDTNGETPQRVRLTPQLVRTTNSFLWEVPNLTVSEVRLRLRWGRDGFEEEGEPSAPFTILPDPRAPVDAIHRFYGEWWIGTGPAFDGQLRFTHGRMVLDHGGCAIPTAVSETTELSPLQSKSRQYIPLQPGSELSRAASVGPETVARCPLTIPLRE